jgi:hypothetical protein
MLDPEHIAFIQTGVSISLAASAPNRLPSMSRGLGCKVLARGRKVCVFVRRSQSVELLANIAATGKVANVFSLPSTNRTMQLKGADAQVRPFDARDLRVIEGHIADFLREVLPMQLTEDVVRAVLSYAPDDLASVIYTPSAAFLQTPGAKAGQPLIGA